MEHCFLSYKGAYIMLTRQVAIMKRSIRTLDKNVGIVIFVGNAARLVTSEEPMATNVNIQKVKLFPANIIANSVIGVSAQP